MSRTKTYIAADWTEDLDAVQQLEKWNDSRFWGLSFENAHDLTQARDSSLNCSIKKSLSIRLDASKTFVLIVGEKTINLAAGSCQYCESYNGYIKCCARGHDVDFRSYIEYECEKAVRDNLEIVVLYKSTKIDRSKCPEAVRWTGKHITMINYLGGKYYWNYQAVYDAIS